jgi:phage gpG-like protein
MAVTARIGAQALRAFTKALPAAVLRGLRKGMPIAVKYAKLRYMERKDNRHPKTWDPPNPPPGPLGIRQGNLARTVRVGEMRYTGKKVIASIVAGSPAVKYAAVHEYGFSRAKPPALPDDGAESATDAQMADEVDASAATSGRIVTPARPYLRPAMRDAEPEIIAAVQNELKVLARATLKGVARFK